MVLLQYFWVMHFLYCCPAVDKVGVVWWDGHDVVVAAVAVDLEGVEVVVGAVVKRYLQKILMQSWRSIIQKQCREIEGIPCVLLVSLTTSDMLDDATTWLSSVSLPRPTL